MSCAFALAAWGLAGAAREPEPALNEKVVDFARSNLGKQVGKGSCTELAAAALKFAGAKRYSLDRPDGDYVWGRPVDRFQEALPGDVLQFRNAEFKGRRPLSKRRWVSWQQAYPHHTAIVSEVRDGGKILTVLHQNVGGPDLDQAQKTLVRQSTIRTDSLQPGGTVRIYRPTAMDEGFEESGQTK